MLGVFLAHGGQDRRSRSKAAITGETGTATDLRVGTLTAMDLRGRVGIVTGGGVRVGRAVALGLARSGTDVFIHYNRSAGPAEETAQEVSDLGVRAEIGSVDLSDPSTARELIDLATESLGTPSILVNSASGFPADTIGDVTLEQWRRTFDLTLASPVFATQALANALPEDLDGSVVNITDVRTQSPYREHFSYIVAKGGIDTFTKSRRTAARPPDPSQRRCAGRDPAPARGGRRLCPAFGSRTADWEGRRYGSGGRCDPEPPRE